MRTSLTKILGGIALLASTSLGPVSTHAQAAEPFRCEPGELYAMNVMVSGVEYWFPVYEMFKQAAKQMGCDTIYTGTPDYDVTKQIASFDQILARQPKGIMVHPMNSDPFIEPINRAISQGTAIVTFAADSPNSDRTAFITSNNTLEGTGAADAVAEAMGGKGEYAVLENPGQDNHDLRISSFIGRMEAKWPDMKLVARAASNQDPNKAYQAVLSMAQANPDRLGDRQMLDAYHRARHAEVTIRVTGIDLLNRASMLSAQPLRDARARALDALYAMAPVRKTLMQMGLGVR